MTNGYMSAGFVDREDFDGNVTPGRWRSVTAVDASSVFPNAGRLSSNNSSRNAMQIRDAHKQYFSCVVGAAPWQDAVVNRGLNV
jgi:hypothetical protein